MAARFGLALILIGVIILTVFLITFQGGQATVDTLLLGLAISALGLIFRRIGRRGEKRQSERFQMIQRLRGNREEDDS